MSQGSRTFKGGIFADDLKGLTKDVKTSLGRDPDIVTIPMSQHIGAVCKPLVKKGEVVQVGQKIGESESHVSAPVHSSVSGEVLSIDNVMTTSGFRVQAVTIQSDGRFDLAYELQNRTYDDMSREEIVSYIREAGIVGLGGAGFPTAVKLSPPEDIKIDTVLVNGAECEPYLTCDQRIMEDYPEEVVKGLKIAMKAVGADQGIIGIEENKPEAIRILSDTVSSEKNLKVQPLVVKYPQGDEKRLIDSCLGREVPSGGLPMNVGVIVINVNTLLSVYEAVVLGKPLYERIVTVTGKGVKNPLNLKVRIGVPISYLIEEAGGYSESHGKVIEGGPMMGDGQYDLESPVIKTTSGIIVFSEEGSKFDYPTNCIKCARCVDACPVKLMPYSLEQQVQYSKWEEARDGHILDCIECGSCSYVCPARRPLLETVKVGKQEVRKKAQRV